MGTKEPGVQILNHVSQEILPDHIYLHVMDLRECTQNVDWHSPPVDWKRMEKKEKIAQNREICHRLVNKVLSNYTCPKGSLPTLSKGEYGKPYLPGSPLKFNISHSGDYLLIAFAIDREVGIDIELHCNGIREDEIIYYMQQVCGKLSEPYPIKGKQPFFDFWVTLEAVCKCTGKGLNGSMVQASRLIQECGTVLTPKMEIHYQRLDLFEGYSVCLAVGEACRKLNK